MSITLEQAYELYKNGTEVICHDGKYKFRKITKSEIEVVPAKVTVNATRVIEHTQDTEVVVLKQRIKELELMLASKDSKIAELEGKLDSIKNILG